MYTKKSLILLVVISLLTVVLFGCSTEPEVDVNWEEVNKALDERYQYNPPSLKAAAAIVGYTIPTIKRVPSGFNKKPGILISKLNPLQEDSPIEVMQTWMHEKGYDELGILWLHVAPLPGPSGGVSPAQKIEIKGIEVYKNLREDGLVFSLSWYDQGLDYHLYGMITDTVTEETYLDMAQQLIEQQQ